jgi:hypothetical protein
MNSDRKKTGQIPKWMADKMGTTVSHFVQLNTSARQSVLADMAKMCGYTLVPTNGSMTMDTVPDNRRGKRNQAGETHPDPAHGDAAAKGNPPATIPRGDKTPAMRLEDPVRLSPVVVEYEAIRRADRTKEPGKSLLTFVNILASSYRRKISPTREGQDPEANAQTWSLLVEASSDKWRTDAEFVAAARKSFGGNPKSQGL